MQDLSEEGFEEGKAALLNILGQRGDSMRAEFDHLSSYIESFRYDFNLDQLLLALAKNGISRTEYIQFCMEQILDKKLRKQIAVAVVGCPSELLSRAETSRKMKSEAEKFAKNKATIINMKVLPLWKSKQRYFPCIPTLESCPLCHQEK